MARSNMVESRAISRSGSTASIGVSKQSLELLGRTEALLVNVQNAGSDGMLELSHYVVLCCTGAFLNRDDASVARGPGSGSRSSSVVKRRRSVIQGVQLRLKKKQPEFDSWATESKQFTALREEIRLDISRRINLQQA